MAKPPNGGKRNHLLYPLVIGRRRTRRLRREECARIKRAIGMGTYNELDPRALAAAVKGLLRDMEMECTPPRAA